MTIRVLIHRQTETEPAKGNFRAFALAEGNRRGPNLLMSGVRELETAKTAVRDRLTAELTGQGLPAPEFDWTVEDWKTEPLQVKDGAK